MVIVLCRHCGTPHHGFLRHCGSDRCREKSLEEARAAGEEAGRRMGEQLSKAFAEALRRVMNEEDWTDDL